MNNQILMRLYRQYNDTLVNQVLPYWIKFSVDQSGAINNCLSESGDIISKDRYIWSQGRALWTFSAMYNRIEAKSEYLDIANGLFRYLKNISENTQDAWNYRYDDKGNVLDGPISIYVDGFVLAGMTEYYLATGSDDAAQIALKIYENTLERLSHPDEIKVAPYVIPKGMKTHGVNMIFSFFYYCLGKTLKRDDICSQGYRLATEVLEQFYVPQKDAVLEFVNADGSFSDTPEGRSCVPGHVIECMWFLITIFADRGETEKIEQCCKLIKRHIELGLDDENGGITLALDIDGKHPVFWGKPSHKAWWVHVEALVATAYAYKHTGDEWFMDMHCKINEYAFSHYPNGYGDWHNWLDKYGNIAESAALPVKDPFHLPRGLIYLCNLLENSISTQQQTV